MSETNTGVETTNPETGNTSDVFLDTLGFSEAPDETTLNDDSDIETATDEPAEQTEPEGREYKVTYRGKEQTVRKTDADLVTDIQKSMDYDAVRKERDTLKESAAKDAEMKEALHWYAQQNGMTDEEYVGFLRERMGDKPALDALREEFPNDSDAALKEILAGRKAKNEAIAKAEAERKAAERVQADLEAVRAEYPDFDPDNLTEDVKTNIESGMSPVEAMRYHELITNRKQLAEANAMIEALKKAESNRKTTPPRADSKSGEVKADVFLNTLLRR